MCTHPPEDKKKNKKNNESAQELHELYHMLAGYEPPLDNW